MEGFLIGASWLFYAMLFMVFLTVFAFSLNYALVAKNDPRRWKLFILIMVITSSVILYAYFLESRSVHKALYMAPIYRISDKPAQSGVEARDRAKCEDQLNACAIELLRYQKDSRECLAQQLEAATKKLEQRIEER